MKFKLLAGQHVQADKTAKPVKVTAPDGTVSEKYPSKRYVRGDVVESDDDLAAKHGAGKFMMISDRGRRGAKGTALDEEAARKAPLSPPPLEDPKAKKAAKPVEAEEPAEDDGDELDGMTVAELRELAEEEEVDLSGVHLKAEIVEKIRAARE